MCQLESGTSLAEAMIDTFQIPFFSVSAFLVFDMFPLEKFIKLKFFLQLLILDFILKKEKKVKSFPDCCSAILCLIFPPENPILLLLFWSSS